MEPRRKLEDQDLSSDTVGSDYSSDGDAENERIGNNDWCVCGKKCRAMQTYTESYCCQDTNEIPEDFFKGKILIIPEIIRILNIIMFEVRERKDAVFS